VTIFTQSQLLQIPKERLRKICNDWKNFALACDYDKDKVKKADN